MVGARLAALLLVTAVPAAAQSVRGRLSDSVSRAPLAGAFLTLVDEHGVEQARSITNGAGEFLLTAPAPGVYRLRSKRIGFRPYLSRALTLQAGETISFSAAIDPVPLALSQVVVEGERQCDVAGGASVAAVWDEIREALAAVSWTSRDPGYWYSIRRFERETTPGGRPRGPDSTWGDDGYRRIPIKSAPAEQLEREGFVVTDDQQGWTYWGPDADVLISGPFLRTHCFETKSGRGETEELIGLSFTPARGRTLPDITGTLWIDRTTAMLHYLDFTYTRLPQELVAPRAGGRIEFLRVPSGAWIVRDWVIRMPVAQVKQRLMGMGTQLEVVSFKETGGNAVVIKTRAGIIIYGSDSVAAAIAAAPALAPGPPPAPSAPVPGSDVPTPPPAAPPPARAGRHSPNLIERPEIDGSTTLDAYALVQESRPTWLHSRGAISVHDPSAGMLQVYLNGQPFGDVTKLREIATRDIREVRFFGTAEAQMRFGTGHAGGVIDVATGAVAPTGPIAAGRPLAPPPPPEPPSAPASADDSTLNRARRGARNQSVLAAEEFANSTAVDAMALVQEFRPNWLRGRGVISINDQSAGDVRVYLNGVPAGDVTRLRDFRRTDIRELRFLSAGEAQQRYGLGHGGGVIEVWMK